MSQSASFLPRVEGSGISAADTCYAAAAHASIGRGGIKIKETLLHVNRTYKKSLAFFVRCLINCMSVVSRSKLLHYRKIVVRYVVNPAPGVSLGRRI